VQIKKKNQMKFKPFPEIITERLFLRRINESDCDVILFLRSDKTINKFIKRPESEMTKNKADALNFIKKINDGIESNNFISWGITLKGNSKIIGTICLWNFSEDSKKAEVGYDLNPLFQRKGIMSEAIKNIIAFGFNELRLIKIEAYTHKENESSKSLLEKNGFILMGQEKDENNSSNLIFEIEKTSNL
jgi:ribosomal-protein-alanine N-acetyltransferase